MSVNNSYKLLKELKKSAMMQQGGSYLPPEPLPNSVKAKQLEQQALEQQTLEASQQAAGDSTANLQKAQADAVNKLQEAQQQIQELQGKLQTTTATQQQESAAVQAQAEARIQAAEAKAEAKVQAEQLKGQQKLLSMQEKYTKTINGKGPVSQSHILTSQLKRMNKRVEAMKSAEAIDVEFTLVSEKKAGTIRVENRPQANIPPPAPVGASPAAAQPKPYSITPEEKANRAQNLHTAQAEGAKLRGGYAGGFQDEHGNDNVGGGLNAATKDVGAYAANPREYMGNKFTEENGRNGFTGLISDNNYHPDDHNIFRNGAHNIAWGVGQVGDWAKNKFMDAGTDVASSASNLARGVGNTVSGIDDFGKGMFNYAIGGNAANRSHAFDNYNKNNFFGRAGQNFTDSGRDALAGGAGVGDIALNTATLGTGGLISKGLRFGANALGGAALGSGMNMRSKTQEEQRAAANPTTPETTEAAQTPPSSAHSPYDSYRNSDVSPIPILQGGWKPNEVPYPYNNNMQNQGYGGVGNMLRSLIFNMGMPMMGMPGYGQPNFNTANQGYRQSIYQ